MKRALGNTEAPADRRLQFFEPNHTARRSEHRQFLEQARGQKTIQGIHGTLFYELGYKKKYYPHNRESD